MSVTLIKMLGTPHSSKFLKAISRQIISEDMYFIQLTKMVSREIKIFDFGTPSCVRQGLYMHNANCQSSNSGTPYSSTVILT